MSRRRQMMLTRVSVSLPCLYIGNLMLLSVVF